MTDPCALLAELIAIRHNRHLSQATIARRMGISRPAISRLENDHARDPKLSTLVRYADALGVHIRIHDPKAGPGNG